MEILNNEMYSLSKQDVLDEACEIFYVHFENLCKRFGVDAINVCFCQFSEKDLDDIFWENEERWGFIPSMVELEIQFNLAMECIAVMFKSKDEDNDFLCRCKRVG